METSLAPAVATAYAFTMWERAHLLRWLGLTILLIVAAAMPSSAFAHAGPHPDVSASTAIASGKTAKADQLQPSQRLERCGRKACCEAPGSGCCHSALSTPLAIAPISPSLAASAVPSSDPALEGRGAERHPKPPRVLA